MKIDWQAYDAGLLSPDERSQAEAILASDPHARAELEGFRRFKTALASVKDAEPVPLASLRGRCFKKQSKKRTVFWATGLAAAAFAMFWTWSTFLNEPMPDYGPLVCSKAVSDPSEAAQYLHLHSKLDLQVLDPAPEATIKTVTAQPGLATYELDVKGQRATLDVRSASKLPYSMKTVVRSGVTFHVYNLSGKPAVYWTRGDFSFHLTGLELDELWPLADDLAKETSGWR